ncbi:FecR domain-containing protein [Achromobacter aegrifaciens]|uniref:FecR domain-containing protein n=1 Tax=Achromobacter aegrifaciens TaxID=1287736 RepID=UPI002792340D|nr:FecR domain-containing protein [Achromobacter aegrifaciens]MDQ1764028.1 FecR domain-containing protein [Achromobacter aegrifaciens]
MPPIASGVRLQAAQWLVELQGDSVASDTLRRWREWRAADPEHERAWQHIEGFQARLQGVPAPLARAALTVPDSPARRRLVKALALAVFAGGAASMLDEQRAWRRWTADSRTGTGELLNRLLPDGTKVALNAGTAIDIQFTQTERALRLISGELLITTAPDPAAAPPRAFLVRTGQGSIRALGTRFSVRDLDGRSSAESLVAVFEGAVELAPASGAPALLQAGQQGWLGRHAATAAGSANEDALAWTQGIIVAQDMPLPAFLAELARYRPGRLVWDEAVAHLKVTGTYPTADTDRVLEMLADTLPVTVSYLTRYWVTLRPRPARTTEKFRNG